MTTDLQYLAYTALLTASLWIPYIAAQVMTNGPLAPQNYLDPKPRPVPLWGQRANRAHINAVESFAPFAALVLIAHVAGKADATIAFCAIAFFWLRLAHAVVYWLGLPFIRTVIFTLGWIAVVVLFLQVVR
ncbi:MAG: MAPEG family protein [Hyphomicrobiales bacterium]|nr:MAPEG family protein [Hyphomicrobiales bacterium]MBV8440292.1 MAPEG family protein [Hyphomicrobiales bacterium]